MKLALHVPDKIKAVFGHNTTAYSTATFALSKGEQVEKVWELFCNLESSSKMLSVVIYNATITKLKKGLQ